MKGESIKALKKIKIKDNDEPLVDLKKVGPKIIIDMEPRRLKKEKSLYARKTVAKMLKKAQRFLPKCYQFKIIDGWRSLELQRKYYFQDLKKLRKKHPHWPEFRLKRELNKWVFPPDVGIPPGHYTGGAIDLTICYKNGKSLPMDSKKAKPPAKILSNRQFLKNILEKVGFTRDPLEWWHFSYGDSGWALRKNRKTAIYGLINLNL